MAQPVWPGVGSCSVPVCLNITSCLLRANCPWHTLSLHLNSILSLWHHPSNHKAVPSVSHDLCNGVCTGCCSHYCDKIPDSGEEGLFWLMVWEHGLSQQAKHGSPEHEMAGCTAPALRKQGATNVGAELTCSFFPFYSVWDPIRWHVPPTYRVSFPLSNCFSVTVINTTAKNNFRKKGLVLAYSSRAINLLWCVWYNIASGTGN